MKWLRYISTDKPHRTGRWRRCFSALGGIDGVVIEGEAEFRGPS
ncbi:MAG: hypothetical protein ACLTG0_09320 [Oscillibacter sp.]